MTLMIGSHQPFQGLCNLPQTLICHASDDVRAKGVGCRLGSNPPRVKVKATVVEQLDVVPSCNQFADLVALSLSLSVVSDVFVIFPLRRGDHNQLSCFYSSLLLAFLQHLHSP